MLNQQIFAIISFLITFFMLYVNAVKSEGEEKLWFNCKLILRKFDYIVVTFINCLFEGANDYNRNTNSNVSM